MHDSTTTIEAFLTATAAKSPTPGGGSVAALVGGLSAAIGEMVLNYSVGKKSLAAYQDELRPALAELTRARRMMLQLMLEDQAAYEALAQVQKLPEDSPQRKSRLDPALLTAIRVPQAMSATAIAILEICDRVVNVVNPYLLSDLAVCADLAMAVARCAKYNVRVNLKSVTDDADRRSVEAADSQMLSHAAVLIQRISPRIWARDAQGR
jgi:formiminotetrahydrofolate cyclodeaminase